MRSSRAGLPLSRYRGSRARLDRGHQCRAGAQGLSHRVRDHRRLSRHPGTAAPWPLAHLRSRVPEAQAGGDAGQRASRSRSVSSPTARSRRRWIVADVEPTLVPALRARRDSRRSPSACSMPSSIRRTRGRCASCPARSLPDVHVTISSDITREFREYERASTTTLSAYVQPVIDSYIARFRQAPRRSRVSRALLGHAVERRPPAGRGHARQRHQCAAVGAGGRRGGGRAPGRPLGLQEPHHARHRRHLDGRVRGDRRRAAADAGVSARRPARSAFPLLDINTIGAGGGSIVWVDEGGMLRVGPRSAGADPGPACYGRGGTEPTLTDAHVVRGTVRPEAFLGGRMAIDAEAARARLRADRAALRHDARGGRRQRRGTRQRQYRARHPAHLDRARP